MKKVFLLFSLCLLCTIASAQKPYTIYDWSGQVRIKEYKGQLWQPIQKNQQVSGLDSVEIDKKGTLRVIDNRSNLIYKSTSTGKMRVLTIINDAKKQNSRTLAAVNQELLNGAKGSANAPTMQVAGATTRGDDNDITTNMASTFGWLAKMTFQGELRNNATDLILKRHAVFDGVYFEMKNESSQGYYVNVIHLNKQTRKVSLCYIIEQAQAPDVSYIFLPQGESIQLQDLIFNVQPSRDEYILIGTEDQFIPEQIQGELQYLDIESAQPLYKKYKYFKL